MRDVVAVVLGGYVNGYGIVKSLHEAGVGSIYVVSEGTSIAGHSRHVTKFIRVSSGADADYLRALREISADERWLVLFPSSDEHVEFLARSAEDIGSFCFVPVNENNAVAAQGKAWQHERAQLAGVRVPASATISDAVDLEIGLAALQRPVIVKPSHRSQHEIESTSDTPFRNIVLHEGDSVPGQLEAALRAGWQLLASEIIAGPDSNLYAYTAYRSREGEILGEWVGRKLSQHPPGFGVFATASNASVPGLVTAGRAVVRACDAYGIVEPEFKLDPRTSELVLMEVNFRSMMWHRVGALSGVNLPAIQFNDALGRAVPTSRQTEGEVTLVYLGHEVSNLIAQPGYRATFVENCVRRRGRKWAVFSLNDPLPFLFSLKPFGRLVLNACRSRFHTV